MASGAPDRWENKASCQRSWPSTGRAVRVEQQLRRVAPLAAARRVWAVHPVAVLLARADTQQVAVPDEAIHLGELNPRLAAIPAVEQAQLYSVGHLGEQGEISIRSVPGSAERKSRSRPDVHLLSLTKNGRPGQGGHGRQVDPLGQPAERHPRAAGAAGIVVGCSSSAGSG